MRIRNYEVFRGCMEVVSIDLYRILYRNAYNECMKRLNMLEAFEPEKYNEWLAKWKAERK